MRIDSPDIIGSVTISTVNNAVGDILTYSGNTITRRTATQLLTDIGAQSLLINPVTGTGIGGQITYWNTTSGITSSSTFAFTPTSQLLLNNTVTASSAIAIGANYTPTLVASANNDVLVGLDINPTFNIGSFTGTQRIPLRVSGGNIPLANFISSSNGRLILQSTVSGAFVRHEITNDSGNSLWLGINGSALSPNNETFIWNTSPNPLAFIISSTTFAKLFQTGNFVLQNGGTFTDAGFRLDVAGSTRIVPPANTTGLTLSGYSLTGSDATSAVNISGTWNTTGTPSLILANVTDTASNASSLLMDLRVGNSTRLGVLKSGSIWFGNNFSYIIPAGTAQLDSRLSITAGQGGNVGNIALLQFNTNNPITSTSTNPILVTLASIFSPTSGTATYSNLRINSTINQTGGANGITRGLFVDPTLTAAADWRSIEWSNNTGWGLYGAGTANNYFGGSLGIGNTSLSGYNLRVDKQITGLTTSTGIASIGTIQSDVTSNARMFTSFANTQATSFTLPNLSHYQAQQGSFGLNSVVTNQFGFIAEANIIGATNNFGFRGEIPSGTGRWNLYMNGTASNYLRGNLLINTTTDGGQSLQVSGNTFVTGTLEVDTVNNGTGDFLTRTAGGIITRRTSAEVINDISADYRVPINTLRNNLGDPTAREMALFHGQFTNKFRFIAPTLQEESTDGTNWTTSTRGTSNQLLDVMIGEGQGTNIIAIPTGNTGTYGGYRLTWNVFGTTGYVFLDALYIYNSTNGNTVSLTFEALHNTNGWTTIAGPLTFSNWPGHVYLPHTSIPYSNNSTHYSQVRLTFSTNRNVNTNRFDIYAIEWFGGFPQARRNVESYDRDRNVTFPASITGTRLISTVATGTAPLSVTSTTRVSNLNVATAGTADTWTTARTITIGSTGKTLNGSADVSWNLSEIGAFSNPMTTLGDIIYGGASGVATRLSGNTTTTRQFLSQTGTGSASAIPAWATISGSDVTGAALTETDDTNVTLTLGGTPSTALLRSVSMTLGWTGQLAVSRGGTGAGTLTGVVIGNGTSAMTAVAGTASQLLRRNSGDTAYEFFTQTLGTISGVVLSSPSNGQVLQFNGTNWVNATPAATGVTGSGTTNIVPKFTASSTIGNSIIGDNGTVVSISGNTEITGQIYSPVNGKGNSGTGTVTFNWNDGNIQSVTLTGNCTFAFSNPQSGASYQIIITQDSTGSRTITWPTIHWENKTTPTLTGTASSKDIVTITYDGTNYNGVIAKNFGTP